MNRCAAGSSRSELRACLKMGRGSAAGELWVGQGGERRGRPSTVCSARTNAVQAGKPRRPEGLGGKGPLAALLVGHRPLRVCSLLAPCQSNPSLPNRTPPHFQTGSLETNTQAPRAQREVITRRDSLRAQDRSRGASTEEPAPFSPRPPRSLAPAAFHRTASRTQCPIRSPTAPELNPPHWRPATVVFNQRVVVRGPSSEVRGLQPMHSGTKPERA